MKRPGGPTTEDHVIDVAVIVPCNESHQYSRMKVLPVVELAVRHLEENGLRGALENYTIKVWYRNSRLSSTYGPLAAVDLFFNNSAGKWVAVLRVYTLKAAVRVGDVSRLFLCCSVKCSLLHQVSERLLHVSL